MNNILFGIAVKDLYDFFDFTGVLFDPYEDISSLHKIKISKDFFFEDAVIITNDKDTEYIEISKQLFDTISMIAKKHPTIHKLNETTLFDSLRTLKNTPEKWLKFLNILHYYSVFGKEYGIYNGDKITFNDKKFPFEEFENKFMTISIVSKETARNKLVDIITSRTTFSSAELFKFREIIKIFDLSNVVDKIPSKDIRILCIEFGYNVNNITPDEILSYLNYTITRSVIYLKNVDYSKFFISVNTLHNAEYMFSTYSPDFYAPVFNRNKNLFLALRKRAKRIILNKDYMYRYYSSRDKKTCEFLISTINKISKKSKILHKPVFESKYKHITSIQYSDKTLHSIFKNLPLEKLVTLHNSINYKIVLLETGENLVRYKIRDGKQWIKNASIKLPKEYYENAKSILLDYIKNIYISLIETNKKYLQLPDNILIAYPTTGKKFFGSIPINTRFILGDKVTFGIHWFNCPDGYRVDLDLSILSKSIKIGWNGRFKYKNIYYTGDIVDGGGSKGATELIVITDDEERIENPFLIKANLYSGCSKNEFNFVIGRYDSSFLKQSKSNFAFSYKERVKRMEKFIDNFDIIIHNILENAFSSQTMGILYPFKDHYEIIIDNRVNLERVSVPGKFDVEISDIAYRESISTLTVNELNNFIPDDLKEECEIMGINNISKNDLIDLFIPKKS